MEEKKVNLETSDSNWSCPGWKTWSMRRFSPARKRILKLMCGNESLHAALFFIMIMPSKRVNQSSVYLNFSVWLGAPCKESCKGHCNGPLCAVVQLEHFRQGSKRPEHHVRPFHLGAHAHTDAGSHAHTHTACETPKGLTSLRWLTFHQGRRGGRPRDTFPHLLALAFSSLSFTTAPLSLPTFSLSVSSFFNRLERNQNSLQFPSPFHFYYTLFLPSFHCCRLHFFPSVEES